MVDMITGEKIGDTIDDPQDDRLQAVPTVRLIDFVNSTFDQFGTREYIRMFADRDRGELRFYRRVDGDPGDGEFVRAIVGHAPSHPGFEVGSVSIKTNNCVAGEPEAYNLHYRAAANLVTWLGMMAKEQSPIQAVRFEYWGETGKQALQGTGVGEESLHFRYSTESDRLFGMEIVDCYTAKSTMMARHPK